MRCLRQAGHGPAQYRRTMHKQHGMVLMVMLIIVILGAAAVFVGSLRGAAAQIERDRMTAGALVQARDALIGRAIADDNHPGSLPCPDTDDDGSSELLAGNDCPSYIGRLPWRTLKLPDLRDGSGERLWYALSRSFRDDDSSHINSETQGTLSIGGTATVSNVAAIVIAPGAIVNGASRSASAMASCTSLKDAPTVAQSWCATNYLEGGNALLSIWNSPNLNYQSSETSATFNDRMIHITHANLMPLVERRIAREARSCLDGYALGHGSTYPWAAPVTDTTYYAGTPNTRFGRLPKPNPYGAKVQLLLDDIAALQLALNNYSANPDSANRQALIDAGNKLYSDADSATKWNADPLTSDDIAKAKDLGDKTVKQIPPLGAGSSTVQAYVNDIQITEIDLTLSNFAASGVTPGWASGCGLASSAYWDDWKNLVFYQIADGYQPGGAGSCTGCLSITGSGNASSGSGSYRAVLAVAGKMRSGQTARNPAMVSDYLEGLNQTGKTAIPTTTSFETYRTTDTAYSTINDLALCLDGRTNCK